VLVSSFGLHPTIRAANKRIGKIRDFIVILEPGSVEFCFLA
jgi:hypothetical protein